MSKRTLLLLLAGGIMAFAGVSALAKDAPGKVAVTDGKTVKVDYTLTVDGEKIDTSEGRGPLEFQVGRNQMIPGFEKALTGMKVGEKKTFKLRPEDAYGPEDPKGFQEVPMDKLPSDIKPEAGMVLYFKGPDGQPHPVRVNEVRKSTVVLNFNHPLAGKTLKFDVEIVDVK